jgi:putative DNA primase/helicase
VIGFTNLEGQKVERVIPRRLAKRPERVLEILAELGANVDLDASKELTRHIFETDPGRIEVVLEGIGWIPGEPCFAFPDSVVGNSTNGTIYVFASDPNCTLARSMGRRGTLDGWKSRVAGPMEASDVGVFAIAFAFSVPLAEWMGQESGAFHLFGPSSSGKSTVGQANASVWGCGEDPAVAGGRSFVRAWNTTLNGLELLAAWHHSISLVLDEIKQAALMVIVEGIYLLVNGSGKVSMTQDRGSRPTRSLRTGVLSTGEVSVVDMLKRAGKETFTGQLVRMPDLPVGSSIFPGMSRDQARERVDEVKR